MPLLCTKLVIHAKSFASEGTSVAIQAIAKQSCFPIQQLWCRNHTQVTMSGLMYHECVAICFSVSLQMHL